MGPCPCPREMVCRLLFALVAAHQTTVSLPGVCVLFPTGTCQHGIKRYMCALAHIYTVNRDIKGDLCAAAHMSTMALKEICVQLPTGTCQPWH